MPILPAVGTLREMKKRNNRPVRGLHGTLLVVQVTKWVACGLIRCLPCLGLIGMVRAVGRATALPWARNHSHRAVTARWTLHSAQLWMKFYGKQFFETDTLPLLAHPSVVNYNYCADCRVMGVTFGRLPLTLYGNWEWSFLQLWSEHYLLLHFQVVFGL